LLSSAEVWPLVGKPLRYPGGLSESALGVRNGLEAAETESTQKFRRENCSDDLWFFQNNPLAKFRQRGLKC
jgi:hypothetical protein